jgi:ABC-type phosphate/phosphonate transport system substrate-binding protein
MAPAPASEAPAAIASLPMYDWPEFSPFVDLLWEGVAARLSDAKVPAPPRLDRRTAFMEVWREPGLVLSQTCGYPYVKSLRGKVGLVGAPVYDVPGCSGATYRSFLIVRREDRVQSVAMLRGRRAVINGRDSQSGCSALRAMVAPFVGGQSFFGSVSVSGSHRRSLLAVAEGGADVAAIDAVCWGLAERHEPAAFARLRVLADSPVAPSLPFITSVASGPTARMALLDSLRGAIAGQARVIRRELMLVDVQAMEERTYDRILEIERLAEHMGYPDVV